MPTKSKTEILHFSITGEFLTDHARDLVLDKTWEKAIECLKDNPREHSYIEV